MLIGVLLGGADGLRWDSWTGFPFVGGTNGHHEECFDRTANIEKLQDGSSERIEPLDGGTKSLRGHHQTDLFHRQSKPSAMKSQPFQFVMCGIIQIILDSTVIAQILYYKKKAKKRIKSDKPPIELE